MKQAVLFLTAILTTIFGVAKTSVITTASSLENPSDAVTAIHRCSSSKSWLVRLRANEPLTLELLSCPKDVHLQTFKDSDSDGWPYPYKHQVLLLEKRQTDHIEILTALYSELEFLRVEPGHITTTADAVIWTSNVKCGSCQSGSEGVLLWNPSKKRYDWNESWLNQKAQAAAIDSVLPAEYYIDPDHMALYWTKNRAKILVRTAVHSSGDAHCCPQGGGLTATLGLREGNPVLSSVRYIPFLKQEEPR